MLLSFRLGDDACAIDCAGSTVAVFGQKGILSSLFVILSAHPLLGQSPTTLLHADGIG